MVGTQKTTAPALKLSELPELLNARQVKALLDVASDRTLRSLVAAGRFPGPIKLNARLHRWSRTVVANWFATNGELAAEPKEEGGRSWQFMAGG